MFISDFLFVRCYSKTHQNWQSATVTNIQNPKWGGVIFIFLFFYIFVNFDMFPIHSLRNCYENIEQIYMFGTLKQAVTGKSIRFICLFYLFVINLFLWIATYMQSINNYVMRTKYPIDIDMK